MYLRHRSQRIGRSAPSLLALCLLCSAFASADVLYSNGPYTGNGPKTGIASAWRIDFGFTVADTFTLSASSILTSVDIVVWGSPGGNPTSLDWTILSGGPSTGSGPQCFGPCGGTILVGPQTGSLSSVFDATNRFGYSIYTATFSLPSVLLPAGTYWLALDNAVSANGSDISWDQNDGPSRAWDSGAGYLTPTRCQLTFPPTGSVNCSETFDVNGAAVPEPGSIALFGSAALILAGGLRRKFFRH
jgi:hypothetical protein